jgi:hypothetical protein
VLCSIGANDDGSGLAMLLELARVTKESGATYDYSLMICAFAAEEQVNSPRQHWLFTPGLQWQFRESKRSRAYEDGGAHRVSLAPPPSPSA